MSECYDVKYWIVVLQIFIICWLLVLSFKPNTIINNTSNVGSGLELWQPTNDFTVEKLTQNFLDSNVGFTCVGSGTSGFCLKAEKVYVGEKNE